MALGEEDIGSGPLAGECGEGFEELRHEQGRESVERRMKESWRGGNLFYRESDRFVI